MHVRKQAYEIIINVIKEKQKEDNEIREEILKKSQEKIGAIKCKIEGLLDFEKRNRQELEELCPYHERSFLCSPLQDLRQLIEYEKEYAEDFLYQKGIIGVDYCLISFNDFEKITGLNSISIKKYLEEMIDLELIERQKVMLGYVYKVNENA